MSQPSVCILIASWGRLEYLRDAVDSALSQTYPDCEVLIVDDGSASDVVDWLRQLEDAEARVRVVYQSHRGVAAARANGLAASTAELVCILDSDDCLQADAVARLVEAIQRRQDAELAFCDIRELRRGGKTVLRRYRQYPSPQAMLRATLVQPRLPFKHSGTLFRRQTALDLGSYDTSLSCKVDIDLYLKFLRAGHLPEHVDAPLVEFRMHKNSVSLDRIEGIRIWLQLIDRYGPKNPVHNRLIKLLRVSAELAKRVAVEIVG